MFRFAKCHSTTLCGSQNTTRRASQTRHSVAPNAQVGAAVGLLLRRAAAVAVAGAESKEVGDAAKTLEAWLSEHGVSKAQRSRVKKQTA